MDSKLKVQGRVSKVSNHQLRPKNERASMRKNKNQGASDWAPCVDGGEEESASENRSNSEEWGKLTILSHPLLQMLHFQVSSANIGVDSRNNSYLCRQNV